MLHIVFGALVGAVAGAAISAVVAKVSGKPVTWGAVLGGAAAGLVAGAVMSATLGGGGTAVVSTGRALTAYAAGGASGAATDQVAHNAVEGRPLGEGVAKATTLGAGLGAATFGAGKALAPVGRKLVSALRRPASVATPIPHAAASVAQPRAPPAEHQTYVGYLWSKREMLTKLDLSHFHAMRLRLAIMGTTTERRVVAVPLRRLAAAHVIDHPGAVAKVNARALALREHSGAVLGSGRVGVELQNSVIPSKNMIRVVRDGGDGLFVFDGNGRVEAIRRAFADSPDLAVEVELFETSSRSVSSLIDRLRSVRGLPAGQAR